MDKNKLFIIIFTIFIVALIIVGFIIGGTPISVRDISLDSDRISNFNSIKYSIENYYQTHSILPRTLMDLPNTVSSKDPQTKKDFDYKIVSATSYQLCATFSTDSSTISQKMGSYAPATETNQHKKGYDCITYSIPEYITTRQIPSVSVLPTAAPLPQTTQGTFLKLGTDSGSKTFSINYLNSTVLTVDFSQSIVVDSNGQNIDPQKIVAGDQIEVIGFTTQPAYILATEVRDLSR